MDTDWAGLDRIRFVGPAVSSFQQEPVPGGTSFEAKTDWDREILNNLSGKPSCIRTPQDQGSLPSLLPNGSLYARRSAELGMNMFRFSLEMGRLSPEIGRFDKGLMAKYVGFMALLKTMGQEPMVTLQHYTMPLSLVAFDRNGDIRAGAWEHPTVLKHFKFCMEQIIAFFNDEDAMRRSMAEAGLRRVNIEKLIVEGLVKYFITLNEPIMTPLQGYMSGLYPPFKRGSVLKAICVFRRMVEAHDLMYELLREPGATRCGITDPKVGIAHNWCHFDGSLGSLWHTVANEILYSDRFERDGRHTDFLALQYYFSETPPFIGKKRAGHEYSDHPGFGAISPAGIGVELLKMSGAYPGKDIIVTEFGFPEYRDLRRPYWMIETFRHIAAAAHSGVPVIGALFWSLADNVEWDRGMEQKFGLFKESQLREPLQRSIPGKIRSWEACKAFADAALRPSPESLGRLQSLHGVAKTQYIRSSRR